MNAEPPPAPDATPPRPTRIRAFYSGHSLSDGVPEAVARVAASLGDELDFEVQSIPGSLMRVRSERMPLSSGVRYDALVITERHDLPYAAHAENTARHLRRFHDWLIQGNPDGETLLYHTWLDVDRAAPEAWIAYERQALALWECVASKVNLSLEAAGRRDRVRVLPGSTALVELVERTAQGRVPGVAGASVEARLATFFKDNVHLTPTGTYFLGTVHYAALFGRSPEGGATPPGMETALGSELQRLAWAHVNAYAAGAAAGASRSMAACREIAVRICPAFHALRVERPESLRARAKRAKDEWRCRRLYGNARDERNPFRWPDPSFER